MTEEKWLPIEGFEGKYEVSDQGRVRSLPHVTVDTLGRRRPFPGRVLSLATGKPYPVVNLWGGGARTNVIRVHVLVLAAFVGPRPEGQCIRHLNDNPIDNRLENLAYGTPSENGFDRVRNGNHFNANKTHCLYGHEFTPENIYWQTKPGGRKSGRMCAICARARSSARWRRRKSA